MKLLLPTAVAVLAYTMAACSVTSEGSSPTVATVPPTTIPVTTTSTVATLEATEMFRDCLVANGIDIEPIPLDAQGRPRLELVMRDIDFSDADSVSALSVCSSHLGTGALELTQNPILQSAVVDLLEEFSDCVRSRGVSEFPDPIPEYRGIGGPYPLAEIPYADPDLSDAVNACMSRLAPG
ncbi:MAG: hypothetical protein O6834_01200 [Actinobacteria bacterium]|nr:hypothetical protein [Actinomycetota bacterium]